LRGKITGKECRKAYFKKGSLPRGEGGPSFSEFREESQCPPEKKGIYTPKKRGEKGHIFSVWKGRRANLKRGEGSFRKAPPQGGRKSKGGQGSIYKEKVTIRTISLGGSRGKKRD